MPANLTPQYLAAEQRFKQAASTAEKIEALEEMLAVIPKHKGTEKLQADLKRRLAKLHQESQKKHGSSRASSMYTVPKEGGGQVVLAGAPNTGKSSLLMRLTHALPEIGDYPFTTRLPQPGMMPYENIQIQIVDMPAISEVTYEPWIGNIIRQADLVLIVVDAGSADLLDEMQGVLTILEKSRIRLGEAPVEGTEGQGLTHLAALAAANKSDIAQSDVNLAILREFFGRQFGIFEVSSETGQGIEHLRCAIFESLDIIRIYTKVPGKKADLQSTPFTLKRGSTVLDLARLVHRDFVHTLKYAKAWSAESSRRSVRFDGQMVERTHVLEDGEILELHV
jgi:ribosome-interacting GTPase 1